MKKYKYGDCIPESYKKYKRLKKRGLNPKFVEGWIEVDFRDLLPDRNFLELFYPDILKEIDSDLEFDNYVRVLPHTWLILGNKYIDITKSQFNNFGGIIRYFEVMRYTIKKNVKDNPFDVELGVDDRDINLKRNLHIRYSIKNIKKHLTNNKRCDILTLN